MASRPSRTVWTAPLRRLTCNFLIVKSLSYDQQPAEFDRWTTSPSRPILRPPASTINHIDKSPRNHTLRLLRRVQFIIPQEAVRRRLGDAVAAGAVAVVDEARDVERRGAVEVLGWVIVDVVDLRWQRQRACSDFVDVECNAIHQAVHVHHGKVRTDIGG